MSADLTTDEAAELSRVELEAVHRALVRRDTGPSRSMAALIAGILANRTWQHVNPWLAIAAGVDTPERWA